MAAAVGEGANVIPVANRGQGQFVAAPDPCLTPPLIPYVNVGFNAMATVFSPNVMTAMMPTLFQTSLIPTTTGDEAGVLHPITKGPALCTVSLFPHVRINFLPIATTGALSTGNGGNAPRGSIAVPSATNVFVCCRTQERSAARAGVGIHDTLAAFERLATAGASEPAVSAELRDGGSGWLRIAIMSLDVPARVAGAVRRLRAKGAKRLLIDLRGNPGGELDCAIELANDFLPDGAAIVSLRDEDGDLIEHVARGPARYRLPVLVLTDGGTASAAEIFALALRDNQRAEVRGEMYGKRSACRRRAGVAAKRGGLPAHWRVGTGEREK